MCKIVYNWNPVFKFVMQVKHEYQKKFGKNAVEELDTTNKTVLEYWIEALNNPEYAERIKPLELNQHGNLLLLRYGRFSSIFGGEEDVTADDFWNLYDGFYMECRSIVIDVVAEKIALCPFRKFRNLNECEENSTENIRKRIENAKCVEISNKLDGSMQSASWYNGRLLVAGSHAINTDNSWRLRDGIIMLNANRNYIDMISSYPMYTFIFEYISLKDAHVVKYKKEQEGMYLIGIRNNETGEQASYARVTAFARRFNVPCTQIFAKTFDDVLKDVKIIKSDEQEGFVLNIDGYMVKVKGDDYVQIHKIFSALSSTNLIIQNIADGTLDDLVAKVPATYIDKITEVYNIVSKYITYVDNLVDEYFRNAPKADRKEFMVWVDANVKPPYRGYVRNMYLGIDNNYIKSGNSESPHYKRLAEMVIKDE